MICRKCGELLDEKAKVCPICGAGQMFDSTTKLNPTHSYAEDCAHDEEHQPRKRRAKRRFRISPMLLVPIFFLGMPVLISRLGQSGHNVITIIVVVGLILSFIYSVMDAHRK